MSRQEDPKYLQIAHQLRLELANFKAGELMNGELPLAKRFGVNRHTVRRALEVLENDGFVLRVQGKGTQVLSRHTLYPIELQNAFSSAVSEQGKQVTAQLIRKQFRAATLQEQELLSLPSDSEIFEVQTLRLMEHSPVSVIRHCFVADRHSLFTDYQGGSMRAYLAKRDYQLERYSTVIGARLASIDEASRLDISKKSPVLTVMTLSHDQHGQAFELAHSVTRSDSFQYKIVLKKK